MTNPEPVAVEQVDRAAAASANRSLELVSELLISAITDGAVDNHEFVQAFARHAAAERSRAEANENEAYEIGKREGRDEAMQELDLLTGGDGEYRFCTIPDERHCPDADTMRDRIVSRLTAAEAALAEAPAEVEARARTEAAAKSKAQALLDRIISNPHGYYDADGHEDGVLRLVNIFDLGLLRRLIVTCTPNIVEACERLTALCERMTKYKYFPLDGPFAEAVLNVRAALAAGEKA